MNPDYFRPWIMVLAAILSLCSERPSYSQDVYDSGLAEEIAIPSIDIQVRDSAGGDPTTVTLRTGAQIGFQLNPDGSLFIDPGTMQPVKSNSTQSVLVAGTSILVMLDGETADSVSATENSIVSLEGGVIGDDVSASDNAQVFILNSEFDDLLMSGSSVVQMSGGSIDNPEVGGNSLFAFTGGEVDDLFGLENGIVVIAANALVGDDAFFNGNSRLIASGGEFSDELQFFDNSAGFFTGGYVDDDLVVADNAFVEIQDFTVGDTIEASGTSTTTINGGSFGAIEASGNFVSGPTVNLNGGTTESVSAFLGGTVNIGAATLPDGTTVSAALNGTVNLNGTMAEGLVVEASNNSRATIEDVAATDLSVSATSGGLVSVQGGMGDTIDMLGDLNGELFWSGGLFEFATARVQDRSTLTVSGGQFAYNGIPIADLNATLGDGAYDPVTGELRTVAGILSGVLADGSPFSLNFSRQFAPVANQGRIFLASVPEPTSVVTTVLALAGAAVAWRRSGASASTP